MSDDVVRLAKDGPPSLGVLGIKAAFACLVGPLLVVAANHFVWEWVTGAESVGFVVWITVIAAIVSVAFLASLAVLFTGRGRLPARVSMALASFVIQLAAISLLARG